MSQCKKLLTSCCNSTYSAPIWPVLKPNGKWWSTIDYRKLNQQVPLSQWPMTQLDQEIPKIKGSTILSTLDVASWCYVDDVLMKSSSVEDHLKEIDHVLNQLTTAGAKIALHKGQWCKTKVNYVGLLVGRNGIDPQSNRAQAMQSIKTPTNVSELRSFLGVYNYSRQFIENYADIARPLTSLLKKDEHFIWTKAQDTAMNQLKQCLCSAPCLLRPRKIIISGRWILTSVPQRRPIPAPWKRQASGRLDQQNAASPRMQVFKLRKSFALHCVGNPAFL